MSDHKKIDWLRWHKRKYFIRINCAIMCAILLIVLLLNFPIISNAEGTSLSDYYFIDDLLDRTTAGSYNGQSGYYNVNSNVFNDNWFYPDDAINYYDSIKYVFNSNYDFSNDANFQNHKSLYFFTLKNQTGLFFCFSNSCYFNGNMPANEYYSFSFPQSNSSNIYKVDANSISVYSSMGSAQSYLEVPVDKMITATGSIGGAYPISSSYEFNYLLVDNKVGNSAGGFGVPNPDTSIEDNMFLYGGGVALSSSTFKDGILYVCALPTNTQVNDNYKIVVDVNGFVSVTPDSLFSLLFNGYSMSKMYGIVAGQTNSRQFSGQIEIPFSDFTNGVATLQLDNIYQQCHVSGYDSDFLKLAEFITTNSNGWNLAYAPFYNYVVGAKSFGIKDFSLSLPAFLNPIDEQNKFNINGATVTFNMYISNSDGSKTSEGSYTFTHDFVTGRSNSVDNITKTPDEVADSTNDNDYINYEPSMPVIPNDSPQQPSYQNPLVPSNNTDNSSSNSNVINNPQSNSINNNISIMQSNKYPEKGVMQSFIRIINNDKNNAVNDVNTLVAGNEFINLCNNTLYAVPNKYWNVWLVALKAILGICVSAFFLKILINWAT